MMRRREPVVGHVGRVLRVASVTDRRPYTVLYRTSDNSTLENCFYASDAFQARLLAIEFNNYIKDHPNRIVRIFSAPTC
tara:strand:+ start:47 stop:283 length:237 start_codon:yes stop_codon:yes gene_type:complete